MVGFRRLVGMLVLAGGLSAQTDLKQAVAKWKGAASAGFSLSLGQVSDPGATEGQLILLRLQHKAPYEQRFGMPLPPVRYQFGGFLLHPPVDECGWLERPCINSNPLLANKFDTLTTLDLHQQQIETDLNTYTPPLSPGRYQAAAVMRKQVLVSQSGGQVGFRYAEPEQYLVSNPIALEVRPATEEWLRHTIEAARKTLLAPVRGEDEYMMRERAARQIAAINHPNARIAALELFGRIKGRRLLQGVFRDLPPEAACELMKSRLEAPEQGLHLDYAYVTSYWCAQATYKMPEDLKTARADDARRLEWVRKAKSYEADVMREAMSIIAKRAAYPGEAASRAMRADVLQYGVDQLRHPSQAGEVGDFVRSVAAQVVQELRDYEAAEVLSTLNAYWPLLREAGAGAAALESIVAKNLDSREWAPARRIAMVRLYELDPKRGRKVLLDDLLNFRPTIDLKMMDLLPAGAVPEMDEALLRYLSSWQKGRVALGAEAPLLIAHYLSPHAAHRAKEVLEAQASTCQPGLLAYFVRVEPSYADRWLRRTPWEMHQPIDRCALQYMVDIPPLAMRKVIEDFLVAHLQHEQAPVKWTAARSLMVYGSAAAKKPLVEAFQYFHDWWKDRKAELEKPDYQEGRMLERVLSGAVVHGRAWLTTPSEMQRLAQLCITNRCRNEILEAAERWRKEPLRLDVSAGPYGWQGAVAHYSELSGMEGIQHKLAQFARGTAFALRIQAAPADRAPIAAELNEFARKTGLIIH